MSLKTRLFLSFSTMVALNILLGAILIGSSFLLRSRYLAYERERQMMDLLNALDQTFARERRAVDATLLGIESERDRYRTYAEDHQKSLNQWQNIVRYPSEVEELNRHRQRFQGLQETLEQVFRLVEKGRRMEAVSVMEATALPRMDEIQKNLRELALRKRQQSDRFWESAKDLAQRVSGTSLVLLISIVLTGIGLSVLLYQSVSQPVAKLREGARKIGAGELDLKLEVGGPPELKDLARSFEDMARSLKDLQTQIVQLDRMSAVGTLAGGVAHEINNPLTGVLGQSQLLLAKLSPEDPIRPNIEKIERAAQRCRKIVRGLLDFSRPQEYHFEPIAVDEVIQQALSFCETEIAATRIQVDWVKDDSLPKILASHHHLQQVFLNIVTNAMHAMPQGGTLTIRSRRVEENPGDSPRTGPMVETVFSDTGVGIPPEQLEHIFDPFFTTKEPGKGTGLGLSISFGIVQQHQGSILAESNGLKQGATFRIRIPIASDGSVSTSPSSQRNPQSVLDQIERRL